MNDIPGAIGFLAFFLAPIGIGLFFFAPILIARRRGVNPALIGALSVAATTNRQRMALIAYAASAEPDVARFHREQEATERTMTRAFGTALDARLAPGYGGAPGYVPPSQRTSARPTSYKAAPPTSGRRPRHKPYVYRRTFIIHQP